MAGISAGESSPSISAGESSSTKSAGESSPSSRLQGMAFPPSSKWNDMESDTTEVCVTADDAHSSCPNIWANETVQCQKEVHPFSISSNCEAGISPMEATGSGQSEKAAWDAVSLHSKGVEFPDIPNIGEGTVRYQLFRLLMAQAIFVVLVSICLWLYLVTRYALMHCDLGADADADMKSGIPNAIWFAFVDKIIIGILIVTPFTSLFIDLFGGKDIALSTKQIFVVASICPMVNFVSYLALFRLAPALISGSAIPGMTTTLVLCAMFLTSNARRLERHSDGSFSRRVLLRLFLKSMIIYSGGYCVNILFCTLIFETALKFVAALVDDRDSVLWFLFQAGAELLLVYAFCTLWMPLWKKYTCNFVLDMSLYCRANQERVSELRIYLNFALDAWSLVFIRGALFKMSFFAVFVAIVFNDVGKHIWHYGFKYTDEYIVFLIKLAIPAQRNAMKNRWVSIAYLADQLQYVYVSSWNIPIHRNQWEPEHGMSRKSVLSFADVSLDLRNISYSSLMNGAERCGIQPKCPSFPHFPVTEAETRRFRPLCKLIQGIIFQRYQSRALAKLFTAVLFLPILFLASFTSIRHVPGFVNPREDSNILLAGILFILTDIGEWCVLTFGVFHAYDGISDHVQVYRRAVLKNKNVLCNFFVIAVLYGIYFFSLRLRPFHTQTFEQRYPNVDFEEIKLLCFTFF